MPTNACATERGYEMYYPWFKCCGYNMVKGNILQGDKGVKALFIEEHLSIHYFRCSVCNQIVMGDGYVPN